MGWILYVEDNESLRAVIEEAFDVASDHELVTAPDGAAALALLAGREPPFLIITDLHMPFMTGWQLIERVRENQQLAKIPIVVASSEEEPVPGVEAHISKPFSVMDLLQLVDEYAAREKTLRACGGM